MNTTYLYMRSFIYRSFIFDCNGEGQQHQSLVYYCKLALQFCIDRIDSFILNVIHSSLSLKLPLVLSYSALTRQGMCLLHSYDKNDI
jgi:hypothetical protein